MAVNLSLRIKIGVFLVGRIRGVPRGREPDPFKLNPKLKLSVSVRLLTSIMIQSVHLTERRQSTVFVLSVSASTCVELFYGTDIAFRFKLLIDKKKQKNYQKLSYSYSKY